MGCAGQRASLCQQHSVAVVVVCERDFTALVTPTCAGYARVLVTASVQSFFANGGNLPYPASKAGLVKLQETWVVSPGAMGSAWDALPRPYGADPFPHPP